jgi:uncharacterized membrane protein
MACDYRCYPFSLIAQEAVFSAVRTKGALGFCIGFAFYIYRKTAGTYTGNCIGALAGVFLFAGKKGQ